MIPEYLDWPPIAIALGIGCLIFGLSFLAVGFWFLVEANERLTRRRNSSSPHPPET